MPRCSCFETLETRENPPLSLDTTSGIYKFEKYKQKSLWSHRRKSLCWLCSESSQPETYRKRAECAKLVCKINESRGIALNALLPVPEPEPEPVPAALCSVCCVVCWLGADTRTEKPVAYWCCFCQHFLVLNVVQYVPNLNLKICWNANDGCHTQILNKQERNAPLPFEGGFRLGIPWHTASYLIY